MGDTIHFRKWTQKYKKLKCQNLIAVLIIKFFSILAGKCLKYHPFLLLRQAITHT